MGIGATPAPPTWARAAEALARRVTRRDRLGTVLRRVGQGLLAASVAALLWRLLGPGRLGPLSNTAVVCALLGAGLVVGLVLAGRAPCAAPAVRGADAAWALDRLARAQGRGLAAAAARGPAASEAAFAGVPLAAPPTVRLLPPRGLVGVAAGVLLGVLAVLVPARHAHAPDPSASAGSLAAAAAGADAEADGQAAEREAARLDRRAAASRAVREALDLPPEGPLDPAEVARRLTDAQARAAAARAAEADPALAEALAGDDPAREGLAGLLDPGPDHRDRAATRRRDAAGARARAVGPVVPADRRDVVTRYLDLLD